MINLITNDFIVEEGAKGLFQSREYATEKLTQLDAKGLKANVNKFCEELSGAFEEVSSTLEGYSLDCFEVEVSLSAKGELWLIGGVSTEAKGGIKLVFKKTNSKVDEQ